MAKVFGPMFSFKASGDLSNAIQFLCGHFAKKKPVYADSATVPQKSQREKFKKSIYTWSNVLTYEQREAWADFAKIVIRSPACAGTVGGVTGYNMFMLYYLKYGEYGWYPYPWPPTD